MKRSLSLATLTLAVALLVPDVALAQGFGIKGGITSSNVTGAPAPGFDLDFSGKVAGVGGISYAAHLTDRVALQLEALYFRRDADAVVLGDRDFGFMRVTYLDIPVLIVVDLSGGTTRPNVQLGPEVGFRIAESGAFEVPNGGDPDDLAEELESTYFGWVFGLGLETPAGGGALTLDARYVFGLTDIFRANARSGRKWGSFVLMGGYVF